jgi:hypothetical protein
LDLSRSGDAELSAILWACTSVHLGQTRFAAFRSLLRDFFYFIALMKDISEFLRQTRSLTAFLIARMVEIAETLHELIEQIREQQEWWRQGTPPDGEGIYPSRVFTEFHKEDDEPPSFDLSA